MLSPTSTIVSAKWPNGPLTQNGSQGLRDRHLVLREPWSLQAVRRALGIKGTRPLWGGNAMRECDAAKKESRERGITFTSKPWARQTPAASRDLDGALNDTENNK